MFTLRKQLQDEFGDRTQGGIGLSKRSPNVFIFSDPATGEKHGYVDNWMPDGCFHYTGEGQYGDQRMMSGNASILHHKEEGRALRVFQGARGVVTYIDEFEVDPEQPWYETDAPEMNDGPVRADIVNSSTVTSIPVESQWTEKTFVEPAREEYEAERREAKLVRALADYLRHSGHEVYRHRVVPPGEHKPLFTDLFDATRNLLIEAKGVATREAVRMALGQLADYARFLNKPDRAILLPSRPRADLEALGHSQGVVFIWPNAVGGYSTTAEGVIS